MLIAVRLLSLFLMILAIISPAFVDCAPFGQISRLLNDVTIPADWKHTHRSQLPRDKEWLPEQIDLFFSHESIQNLPYDIVGFAVFLKRTGFYTQKIQLRFNPLFGFYVVAADKISLNDEVISAGPLSFLHEYASNLRPRTKARLSALRSLFEAPGLEFLLEDTSRLAMVITFLSECTDPESVWASYFPLLQTITLPFMLSPEQQKQLNLDNSGGFQVNPLKPLFTSMKLLAEHEEFAFLHEDETLLQWAIATVTSRSFSWGPDAKRHMMVPALDMINHDSYYINRYEYSQTQNLRYLSSRELQSGEEIHIAYRPYATNTHLLQLYGFSIPRLPEDYVLVRMSTGMVEKLTSILQNHIKNNNYILHTDITVNAVVGYDDHIPTAFIRAVDIILGGVGTPSRQAFEYILTAFDVELNGFSTTVEEEEERLKNAIYGTNAAEKSLDNTTTNECTTATATATATPSTSTTTLAPLINATGFADPAAALVAMYRKEAIRLLTDIRQGLEEDMSVCMCSLDPVGFAAELELAEMMMQQEDGVVVTHDAATTASATTATSAGLGVQNGDGKVVEVQVDALGNVHSPPTPTPKNSSATAMVTAATDNDCDECEVTAKRSLKQVRDEKAMRVIVIGREMGDEASGGAKDED